MDRIPKKVGLIRDLSYSSTAPINQQIDWICHRKVEVGDSVLFNFFGQQKNFVIKRFIFLRHLACVSADTTPASAKQLGPANKEK